MISQITSAFQGRRTINPKTVLAFYATVLGIFILGAISGAGVLAWSKTAEWLIPWLFLFGFLTAIALVIGVFYINLKDPSKLMLTQVTGEEYAVIQKSTYGDSMLGEQPRIQASSIPIPLDAVTETLETQNETETETETDQ